MEQIELFEQKAQYNSYVEEKEEKENLLNPLKVAGLFSGIGGIELGFARNGHNCDLLCEVDKGACEVLQNNFKFRVAVQTVRLKMLRFLDAKIGYKVSPPQQSSY